MNGEGKAHAQKLSVGAIVCIVLSVLLLPILIINVTLVIKGVSNKDEPPSVFGVMPLAVTSGSMDDGSKGCIKVGDMIFVKKVDVDDLEIGDVVTFHVGKDYITHRIVDVARTDGKVDYVITQGDANNTTDGRIYPDQIHGKYSSRVGGLGSFILFLQEPWGILLCVGVPVLAYAAYEILSRSRDGKNKSIAEKDAEIERLRALVEEKSAPAEEEKTE